MDIVKILAIIIICAVLTVVLKQYKAEYSLFISIAAGILILTLVGEKIIGAIELLRSKINELGVKDNYFLVAIKSLGIAYLSSFITDLCRDSGQTALASKALLAGKTAIFILCVPMSISLLGTVLEFI